MTPKLSKRQESILSLAQPADTTVDIGCDHGYIATALLERGISARLIASDISAPSLAKTVSLLKRKGLSASTRVGDGMDVIQPYEQVDQVIIAGMGGAEIIGILERSTDVKRVGHYVFQPMKEIVALRRVLNQCGLKIVRDVVIQDRNFYHIITAVPDIQHCTEQQLQFGANETDRRDLDYMRWLDDKQKKVQKIVKNMPKSSEKLDFFQNCLKNIERIKGEIIC